MARIYERFGTRITAQASAAITADTDSTGTQTLIDKASGQNGDGAQWFDVYVDVTAAPSADAGCELYTSGSSNGTDAAAFEYALTGKIPAVADQYRLGSLHITPQEFNAKIKAIDYGFTAVLYLVPVYYADA
jgi:hypothetical protein